MNQGLDPRRESKNKDYNLKIEKNEGYLEARVSGKRTRDTVSILTDEIARTCIEAHCSRILVDVRELEGFLKVYDSHYIVTQDFPKLRNKGIKKVVIVDRAVPGIREWFMETVAVNRGFNLRVFADRKAALEWLRGEPRLNRA